MIGDTTKSVRWFCGDHQPRSCVHPRTIGGPHRGPVVEEEHGERESKSSNKNTVVVIECSSSVRVAQTKSLTRRPRALRARPGIRLPLQGSVNAPHITHAWGFHPGSRDPNRSRGQASAWQGDVTQPLPKLCRLPTFLQRHLLCLVEAPDSNSIC